MPNPNLAGLQPEVRDAWKQAGPALRRAGIDYTVTSAARPASRQEELYQAYLARGRTGLPAAPAGTSAHERGLALDLSIPPEQRAQALPILAQYGFLNDVPNDPVHFTYQVTDRGPDAGRRGAVPVLPPVPGTPGAPGVPGPPGTPAPAPAAPEPSPWWLDTGQVDQLRGQWGLAPPDAAPETAAAPEAGPWWLDSGQVDSVRQQLGLAPGDESAPTSEPPQPGGYYAGSVAHPFPGPQVPLDQVAGPAPAGFPRYAGPGPAPLPPPPAPPPAARPAPALSQAILTGLAGGPPSMAGAGLAPAQVALAPPAPNPGASMAPAVNQRVQQITGSATGPLAQVIQQYAARTGGRSYVADLITRAARATNPAAQQAVIAEAQQYGLGDAVRQLAQAAG